MVEQEANDSQGTRVRRISAALSLALVAVGLILAGFNVLPAIPKEGQIVPFISTLVGVTFYVLYNVRRRRERFDLKFLPDYAFRAAQAVVYLYAILAIFDVMRARSETDFLLQWPPNLIGLFVGMYILHVERAMEGLGYRFEEVLTAILGRSLSMPTRREKDIQLVQAAGKFRDIQQQAEVMAAQAGPPAVIQDLKQRFREVSGAITDRDHDAAVKEVRELSLDFELTKQEIRRETKTVRKVLGMVEAHPLGPIPEREDPSGGRRATATSSSDDAGSLSSGGKS
jgi:hypothetical protein